LTKSKISDCGLTNRLAEEAEAIVDLMLRAEQIYLFDFECDCNRLK